MENIEEKPAERIEDDETYIDLKIEMKNWVKKFSDRKNEREQLIKEVFINSKIVTEEIRELFINITNETIEAAEMFEKCRQNIDSHIDQFYEEKKQRRATDLNYIRAYEGKTKEPSERIKNLKEKIRERILKSK
jgi:hypothetical protein